MNTSEALGLLEEALGRLRLESYDALVERIHAGDAIEERPGASGVSYQLEVLVLWDDRPGGNVRVFGSIDDGGWRAIAPLTRSFIKSPDGTFVGE